MTREELALLLEGWLADGRRPIDMVCGIIASLGEAGLAIVPVEPTAEMLRAGDPYRLARRYKAMINAGRIS